MTAVSAAFLTALTLARWVGLPGLLMLGAFKAVETTWSWWRRRSHVATARKPEPDRPWQPEWQDEAVAVINDDRRDLAYIEHLYALPPYVPERER